MINFNSYLKTILFYLFGIFSSITFTLLLIEICLRLLPVNQGLRALPVNYENPIFKFTPNRTALFSKNWNFDISNKVRINNDGFVNNNEYNEKLDTKLLSIIGDSYVEALMVPFEKSISGILDNKTKHYDNRVYSFAASGAGLSQYLIWAKYAKEKYKSNYFIFVIIANDFSESLQKYESSPGFHRFVLNENNNWDFKLTEYKPSWIRKTFRNSNLAMYLITNLKIHRKFNIPLMLGKSDKRQQYVANFDANVSKEFWNDAVSATNIYLNNIKDFTGVKEDKILFIVDGVRPELYDREILYSVRDSFWVKIRNYFIQQARLKGYEVVDMQQDFVKDYNQSLKRFEFETDSHWNSYGHRTVAKSVLKSFMWNNFIRK